MIIIINIFLLYIYYDTIYIYILWYNTIYIFWYFVYIYIHMYIMILYIYTYIKILQFYSRRPPPVLFSGQASHDNDSIQVLTSTLLTGCWKRFCLWIIPYTPKWSQMVKYFEGEETLNHGIGDEMRINMG